MAGIGSYGPAKMRQRVTIGERENAGEREERERFPELETLISPHAIYSNFLETFVDHNFHIRTPMQTYFVSTNSV